MKFRPLLLIIFACAMALQVPWLLSQGANASSAVPEVQHSDAFAQMPTTLSDDVAHQQDTTQNLIASDTTELHHEARHVVSSSSMISSRITTQQKSSEMCRCIIYFNNPRGNCNKIPAITFFDRPSSGQAVIKINLDPYQYGYTQADFAVQYGSQPSGWSLHIGDSESNDGSGSDAGHQSNDTEMYMNGNDMTIHLADAIGPSSPLTSTNVITGANTISFTVRNKYFALENHLGQTSEYERDGLYALHGQADSEGAINYDIYAAFNRTISNAEQTGSGVGRVDIDLCSNPEVDIRKTSSPSPAEAGETLTYQIELTATNETAAIVLTDTLPHGLSYVPDSLQGGATYDSVKQEIHYNGPLTPGTPHLITYQATFTSTAALGSILYSGTKVKWDKNLLETGTTTVVPDTDTTAKTLALIYANGDNDLSTYMPNLVKRVEKAAGNSNLVTFLLLDGPADGDAYLYRVKHAVDGCITYEPSTCPMYDTLVDRWAWDDSIAVPDSLSAFLIGARNAYPDADKILLSLVGHGYGWMSPVLEARPDDQNIQASLPNLRRSQQAFAPTGLGHGTQPGGFLHDDHAYRSLSVAELGSALAKFHDTTGKQIDLIYLDACSMAMSEVAYEIYASGGYSETGNTGYLLASENTAWTSFRYEEPLSGITGNPNPLNIAINWLEAESNDLLPNDYPFTLSLVDLSEMEQLRTAQDQLAKALIDELPSNKAKIDQAFMNSSCFDSNGDYKIERPADKYCDLSSFAEQLMSEFPSGPVHSAAKNVTLAVDNAVKKEHHHNGIPWNDLTQYWRWGDLGGLSVYLPLITDEWRRLYYNDINLQFAKDGFWDEFLSKYWQNKPLPALPSGMDVSIRPAQQGIAPIQLQGSAGSNNNILTWTVTGVIDGVIDHYDIRRTTDRGKSYMIVGDTPSTDYSDTNPPSGIQACYQVEAFDGNNSSLGRSNVFCIGEEATITDIMPRYGLNSVSSAVYIYGNHFSEPLSVTLGSQRLHVNTVEQEGTSNRIRVVVPEGLIPGTYDITVQTESGHAVKTNAYNVIKAAEVDDLLSNPEWMWTNPSSTMRVGRPNNAVGLNVQHLGGTGTVDSVPVEFRLGSPNGELLGRGYTSPLSPDATEGTNPVSWMPTEPSHPYDDPIEYQVCAIIDPDNEVTETNEENNVVCRTIPVLPPICLRDDPRCEPNPINTDSEPPKVEHFVIQDDALMTLERSVTLDVTATDYGSPASGVSTIKYIEFEYSFSARSWVPIQGQRTWIDYQTAQTDYPWKLIETYAMRYIEAWAADSNGNISSEARNNISLSAGADVIDLVPTTQEGTVFRNEVVFYRILLDAGQSLTASMTPTDGNPDMYIWGSNQSRPWYDPTPNASTGVEQVQFTAPVKGTYQIEIHGPNDGPATYHLEFGATHLSRQVEPNALNREPREMPEEPAVALDDWPKYYDVGLPPVAETSTYTIYLPVSIR